jgi:hypothetical protein
MDEKARNSLIKRLQAEMPRGAPFDLAGLGQLGITPQLAAKYVRHGWLRRLQQGVYAFPGDELAREAAVLFLQVGAPSLHVGGKSALALQGVQHNLSARDALVLWGDRPFSLPGWFKERFPTARFVASKLFEWNDGQAAAQTITTPPGAPEGLRVAVPERAVLELLSEVGLRESLEEARSLFDGLRNMRKDVAGELLSCCTSVKAVRLFLTWSRATGLLDVDALRARYPLRVGSDARWMSRLSDGTLLTLKPYG